VIYHLTNYENFPASPDYQFPLEDISVAYLFSIPLVVLVEWYFQYATSKHLAPKKAVIHFMVVLSIGFLLIFSIAYFSHPSSARNSYAFILSLLLSAVSSFAWIAILYGRKLVLRWTKSEGLDGLIIKSGNTTHQVKFRDIVYLHSVNKIVFARVRPGSSIVTNFSLAELESMLPKSFLGLTDNLLSVETVSEVLHPLRIKSWKSSWMTAI